MPAQQSSGGFDINGVSSILSGLDLGTLSGLGAAALAPTPQNAESRSANEYQNTFGNAFVIGDGNRTDTPTAASKANSSLLEGVGPLVLMAGLAFVAIAMIRK